VVLVQIKVDRFIKKLKSKKKEKMSKVFIIFIIGTNLVGPSNVVQPSTLQGTNVRGRGRRGYSSSSN
jgi:hypothetical protein